MLWLSRRKGRRIHIYVPPSDKETVIEVVVKSFSRLNDPEKREVMLGLSAPKSTKIVRDDAGVKE